MFNKDKYMTDTIRLDWLIENQAVIRSEGHQSPYPYYWVVYVGGRSSDSDNDPRAIIDFEMANPTPTDIN